MKLLRWSRSLVVAAGAWWMGGMANAADVVQVLSSYPAEVTDTYKQAFEKKHPQFKVEILSKSASDFVQYLQGLASGQRPDVVWASDPGVFGALAQAGLLQAAPQVRNAGIPAAIGRFPMDGPQDLYFGQAVSGYGLMWNVPYLREHQLVAPRSWADVAAPTYFGHVLMSSPSRSGTTHLMVEAILQAEGWEAGWALLTQIGGNCRAIAERSLDVPASVNTGRAGVGLVVDFFALAGRASRHPVDFAYPLNTVVLPASVAMVAGGHSVKGGELFTQFTLSREGQELLYEPQISRLPASPFAAASMKVPSNFPNVYAVARKSTLDFDLALAEQRRALVTRMFDAVITQPHAELHAAMQVLNQAERALRGSTDPQALALLQQARKRLAQPVVTLAQSQEPSLLSSLQSGGRSGWSETAKGNYREAAQLAAQASARAKGTR